MILGIGLVSLATLFPIGLLRLRDATRYTRSSLLLQTAAADMSSRGLFYGPSFQYAENLNYRFAALGFPLTPWYSSPYLVSNNSGPSYNPLYQDTAFYGDDPFDANNPGAWNKSGSLPNPLSTTSYPGSGPGLPFAYDPLWRYQTISTVNSTPGYYMGDTYEARFGSGIGYMRPDPDGRGVPSAHGLQRITNFNRPYIMSSGVQIPVMPMASSVPNVFVSQEDMVWQDPQNNTYTLNGQGATNYGVAVTGPSPVLPDLSPPAGSVNQNAGGSISLLWRYSWMFTGQLTNAGNASCYDGNIVIWENRPFGIQVPASVPYPPGGSFQSYQVEGETVVEAIFGYSNTIVPSGGPGYGSAADRTVLLRWPDSIPDPVVRVGDWIADVTYERQQLVVYNPTAGTGRFLNAVNGAPAGYPNPANNFEWDNTPPQRCYWYQIQKITSAIPDATVSGHRSMIVYVNQSLVSRTVLMPGTNGPLPVYLNAALIAPNVINVIPQTFFVRSSSNGGQSPFGTVP